MKQFLPIFLLVFLPAIFFAQDASKPIITRKTANGKAKNLFKRGMQYAMNGKNSKALKDFTKVLNIEPNFIDAYIQMAGIKNEQKQYAQAEEYLEKALSLDENYNLKVWYVLARMEARQKKYTEALEHFEGYLSKNPKNEILREKAQKAIKSYAFVQTATKNPVPFHPKTLGSLINTRDYEYLPSLTADGQTLIYTKRIRGQEDFYVSEKNNGKWGIGTPMLDINDPMGNEGAQSISADGRFLAFTACDRRDGYGSCDIYYSELRDGHWTAPANIGAPINGRAWDTQPSVSANGSSIYFASKRKGGIGGSDLWLSTRTSTGEWGKPKNLGERINSKEDEQSPFIHPDGQTLYFMSAGHPGMGKTDLFYSRKQADGSWGEPINMGYPINTEAHEGALVISLDGKTAYFASNRDFANSTNASDAKLKNETDLYSFDLYKEARPQPVTYVKATVLDGITGEKLLANVELMDLQLQKTPTKSTTDEKGEFLVCLPIGKNYGLNVSKEGYLFHSENFALEQVASLENPFLLTIKLYPIPIPSESIADTATKIPTKAQPIILKNVFFETASAELRKESISELTRLKNLLEKNPTLKIQINGHTDNVGSDNTNMMLSDNRAKAVYSWLIANGIASDRLKYKGFGETQPISSNETTEGRQENRRTEFVVL